VKYKKIDDNQNAIVKLLRKLGATVEPRLAQIGKGCPDILVGYEGLNYLVEIKDGAKSPSQRKLTPDEQLWHDQWRGQVRIIETEEEAEEWMKNLRQQGL
jgi:hypothetical protein